MDKLLMKRFLLVLFLGCALLTPSASAWARDKDARRPEVRNNGGHHDEVVVAGHERFHYRDGRFYRPGWFGFEIALNVPPLGIVVSRIPAGYKTVVVGSTPYYYYNHIYYRPCPTGYVVVPAPAAASNVVYVPGNAVVSSPDEETVTINIPNVQGSFTPVLLVEKNGGYVGPQGEFYAGSPTVDQLRALYGN